MQNDPTHQPKAYKTLVFKSNGGGKINDAFIEAFKKYRYNAISYYSLFPAIREYSKQEVDSVLEAKGIDLNIVIDIQSKSYSTGTTFNTYNIGGTNVMYGSQNNSTAMFFSMFMFDLDKDTPFVRVDGKCESGRGAVRPLAMKFIDKALDGLIDEKVIIKPSKG